MGRQRCATARHSDTVCDEMTGDAPLAVELRVSLPDKLAEHASSALAVMPAVSCVQA
jgi:hypothetical protein